MSWVQWLALVAVVGVTNFVSLALSIGLVAWASERKKRKVLDPIMDKIEQAIMDEIHFNDIVQNFDRGTDEEENGETDDKR